MVITYIDCFRDDCNNLYMLLYLYWRIDNVGDKDYTKIGLNEDDFCPNCLHSGSCIYQKERLSDIKEKINRINEDIYPYEVVEMYIACVYHENKNNIN